MASEMINKILAVEDETVKNTGNAEDEAKKILSEAKAQGEKLVAEMKSRAQKTAEGIIALAEKTAEETLQNKRNDAAKDREKLIAKANEKKNDGIKAVTEKIIPQ